MVTKVTEPCQALGAILPAHGQESTTGNLAPPQARIINFLPSSGRPGSTFVLQGSHFVGTTNVTINGAGASFSVLTANFIRVTVPAGATTGTISVTNAGGTSTSTKSFTVQ